MNLICGINPVLEALNAGTRHFDRLLIVKGLRNRRVSEAIGRASQMGIPLRFEAREALDRLAGGVAHQGIIAVVSAKPVIGLEDLLAAVRAPALVVVLDGVEDPRNLGAILRTAEAAGADGVVLPERHSAGLSEAVGRSSAGALEYVRVARVGNVAQAIETLKTRGLWVVGFDAAGTERWDVVDLRRPVALVLGGEGRGIRRLVRERCDHLVSLPLFGHVSSLNVSVAAGIALYEVIRQRGAVPSHVKPIPLRPAVAQRQVVGPAPDDAEHDPGHLGQERSQVPTAEDDSSAEDSVGFVRIDDEDGWSGPTVLKPSGGGVRHPQGGPRRRRLERQAPGPAGGSNEEARPGGDGRHGRRRRRRGHHGGEPGAFPTQTGAGDGSSAGDPGSDRRPASHEVGGDAQGTSGGPAGGAQRRRRRRRRRRTPVG
ncbi:MAG: 23S rRNA (guanosine(2251)-2'-O)-methyltransferase RlmB [Acidobacteria bacterium]|nr:23S rRNA (guanosine(2251)-2'-O)-methyltransferase RlmB [Acidobacteriota bacterium]